MGAPNNKKYNKENIIAFIKETYPNLEVLEVEESCVENKHKPRVRFTNGYETKFAYFDNIKRGKFKFSEYTPSYVKNIVEEHYKVSILSVIHLDEKYNSFTKFRIETIDGKIIEATGNYITSSITRGINIFHDSRKEAWTEREVMDFLTDEQYGLSDVELVYDRSKPFNCRKCIIYFTYDKVEMNGCFRSLKDALIKKDYSSLNINRGETFYKNFLKEKFNIENVGFDRLYKHTTKSGKKTFMADIYNIEDGTKVKGVLTDNLKKRGYFFKSYQGELMIEKRLTELGIDYVTQKTFSECNHKQPLRFDFYLPKHNMCIEYDGEFHYIPFAFTGGEKGLKAQQKRDAIKNKFCIKEGIKLIRIPYFEKDNIPNIIQDIVSSN